MSETILVIIIVLLGAVGVTVLIAALAKLKE